MIKIKDPHYANRQQILEMVLTIYDAKPPAEKRKMVEAYAEHIAVHQTLAQQEEWIHLLEFFLGLESSEKTAIDIPFPGNEK
ncbi:MAG TPA: hypothetical protein VIH42_08180 [Thermoguttaceae bacterium]